MHFSNSMHTVVAQAWQNSDDHRLRVMEIVTRTQIALKCRRALRRCRRTGAVLRLPKTGTIHDQWDLVLVLLIVAEHGDSDLFLRFLGKLEKRIDEWIHSAKTRS